MPSTPTARPRLYIGCAGWAIPRTNAASFPAEGSVLERYAQVFNAVEINSSFYRPHQPATYRRWAGAVPQRFRFAVKMPRTISHDARLHEVDGVLETFLGETAELGAKLGCLLLQLPPSLVYEPATALAFFDRLRRLHRGPVACEPRHASWFTHTANAALAERGIARVAADPARVPRAAVPGGDRSLVYLRLHGSPRIYYDPYPPATLHRLRRKLLRPSRATTQRWCMFDNTAAGHATGNALALIGAE